MKRDDHQIATVAAGMVLGELSETEAALGIPAEENPSRDIHETWLYFHLEVASRARAKLDRATCWDREYAHTHRERELALAAAATHYRALQECGGLPPLLAQMVLAEGLLP